MVKSLATVKLDSDPSIRRSHLSPDKLLTRPVGDEIVVVGDLFKYTAKTHAGRTACSYRDIVDVVEERKTIKKPDGSEEEKVWKYFTLSPPKSVTYTQLDTFVTQITSGLVSLGFTNLSTPVTSRPRVSIYADTSLNWQLMSQSFARLGHVITTAYTTLGEEGLWVSWDEPDVELCFCGEAQLGMVSKVLGRAEKVKYIVYDHPERADPKDVEAIKRILEQRGGRLLAFEELRKMGEEKLLSREELGEGPKEDDLFCIMYTSGSTGSPKGVLLTHKNIVCSLAGSVALWAPYFKPKEDLLLAFLPLAHILEQFLEFTFYLLGIPIGYATVKTLLDDSVRNCQGDFAAYKPTLIGGVPAIYEIIRKGMVKKIHEAGPVVGTIFSFAVSARQTLPWPLTAVIDKVLFARVKQATGGRLRYAVSGGGALSRETQLFLSTVLAPVMGGYGLTETCGMATIATPNFWELSSVGVLGPSCEIRLADYPEAGYLSTNDPPQGEVQIRGGNVFKGYFKNDELTAESFTPDGFFRSGDIGEWRPNGTLKIIDRVKNLVKMQNGEYVALDKVESIYKACDVTMMLCVCAGAYADRPVAVVYPHEGNLRNHLKSAGLPSDGDLSSLTTNPDVKKLILKEMLVTGKKGGLKGVELIKAVILTPEEWSPDNGMLTPAMKLARPFITKKYAKEIEASYK